MIALKFHKCNSLDLLAVLALLEVAKFVSSPAICTWIPSSHSITTYLTLPA